ncbi:MAG: hypothetical protein ACRDY6_20280, partial [Acidimicrobiia bacterium]
MVDHRNLPAIARITASCRRRRGRRGRLPTAPEQILVTTGAQQAINLAAVEFVSAGDPLVV